MLYSPRMKNSASKTILVFRQGRPDTSCHYRISGILRYCARHPDWDIRIIATRNLQPHLDQYAKFKPDGIIGVTIPDVSGLSTHRKLPLVALDAFKSAPEHICVNIDNSAVAQMAGMFLIKRNYKHLAYVGPTDQLQLPHSKPRENAIRMIAEEHETTFDAAYVKIDSRIFDPKAPLIKWLKRLPLPCGIMTYSDAVSRILLNEIHRAGLLIPQQIAIIGVDDDISICENLRPTLSSVLPDFEYSGYLAASLLDKAMSGERINSSNFIYGPRRLTERESTQDTRGIGRIVSLAQAHIHTNGLGDCHIAEVASTLHVSQRLLQANYKKVLGHSMRSDLTAKRIEKAKSLLTTTILPLTDIAEACGVKRFASFAALFKRHVGVTMSAYRKSTLNGDS